MLADSSRDVVRRAVPALRALRDAPPGTKMVWATAASGEYPVYVGNGLTATRCQTGEGNGSDHRPVIADLAWRNIGK